MRKCLWICIIVFMFYIKCPFAFSKNYMEEKGLKYQEQLASLSLPDRYYEVPICPRLTVSFMTESGEIKPSAHPLLPVYFYLHESIPEQSRPSLYAAADDLNKSGKTELIRISSEIDRGDPQVNSPDQRNVIYLFDKDKFTSITGSSEDFNAGLTRVRKSQDVIFNNDLPYLPITEVDIIIRREVLTDLEFYRSRLIFDLQVFGFERDFSGENIESLRMELSYYIADMTSEEIRDFFIERAYKIVENQNPAEPVIMDLDQEIADIQSLSEQDVVMIKDNMIQQALAVDLRRMRSRSSATLENVAKHEMAHALGLEHFKYPLAAQDGIRPLMREDSLYRNSEITIPQHVDFYALFGLSCLYDAVKLD